MATQRNHYSAKFKAKVALEVLKEQQTLAELGSSCGFVYLAAVLDWHSRYVLSWALSNSREAGFCRDVLEAALRGGRPEIFNTDQGAQFTSPAFTGRLAAAGVRISMDGRGRALDNVFVERLWRSVKYAEVYLHDYGGMAEAQRGLGWY